MNILGLDIGGANIKAADNTGRAMSRPFAIWNHPERLKSEIAAVLQMYPCVDRIAVTMTGELADCFSTKSEGVRFILDAVDDCVRPSLPIQERSITLNDSSNAPHDVETVVVWTTDGRFVTTPTARESIGKVASANWLALAAWCGTLVPDGSSLLIDIGSTTTDVIPLVDGKPAPVGLTDVARLQSGELSYSGIWRTPLCSVAHSVPFREGYCSIAAEHFSTMLDVHLLLGNIPEDAQNDDTANRKPATKAAAHDRIVRMLCCDRDEIPFDEAVHIANFLADVQRRRLHGSLDRVAQDLPSRCQNVIISGSGSVLARQLVTENRFTRKSHVISLADQFSPEIASAACAYAVAQLAKAT